MKRQLLMCPPTHFEVSYMINPWMNQGAVSVREAQRQWQRLHDALAEHVEVLCIEPQAGLPDMVFTANAGVVVGDRAMASHFLPQERRGEEAFFKGWFRQNGYQLVDLPLDVGFEGAGDCLLDPLEGFLWTGLGPRTEPEAYAYLSRAFGREVVTLRLVDPRYYHLDTCFCPLEGGHVMYHPGAFHPTSRSEIERRVAPELRIEVDAEDAAQFACNAVNVGRQVFLHRASDRLQGQLAAAGYTVHRLDLSEFLKAGGSAKCLTLALGAAEALARFERTPLGRWRVPELRGVA
jgi:N-dimethylarginine dimethylaminohydrolase